MQAPALRMETARAGMRLAFASDGGGVLAKVARLLEADGATVDLAAAPVRDGGADPLAHAGDICRKYSLTPGEYAQAHPDFAALHAPGLAAGLPRDDASESILRAMIAEAKDWEERLAQPGLRALVVSRGGPLMACRIAEARGIAVRSLEQVSDNAGYWASDRFGTPEGGSAATPAQHMRIERSSAFCETTRSSLRAITERRWLNGGFAAALPATTPTIVFVLEAEPSTAIVRQSPDFTNQHAAIVALSRDLPAGIRIAVLEHPDMPGRRPPNFHRQLRDLKNVLMLPPETAIAAASDGSAAVAGIAGEGLLGAALSGKPVIAFARNFAGRRLPNVHCVEDIGDLTAAIGAALGATSGQKEITVSGALFSSPDEAGFAALAARRLQAELD